MIETEPLKQNFWEQGFLVLDNFFEPGLMDEVDLVIRRYFGENPQFRHEEEFLKKSQTEVIPWFPQQSGYDIFDRVEKSQQLVDLTSAILGEGWSSLYCMTMFSGRGTRGQAWHQDCSPDDASVFNLNRLIYTEDLSPEVGGQTVVVPGTHRRGELTVGAVDEDFPDQVVLTPRKGTLVMLHGHTWHRVFPIMAAAICLDPQQRLTTCMRCALVDSVYSDIGE